jgi:hypothetical protein
MPANSYPPPAAGFSLHKALTLPRNTGILKALRSDSFVRSFRGSESFAGDEFFTFPDVAALPLQVIRNRGFQLRHPRTISGNDLLF